MHGTSHASNRPIIARRDARAYTCKRAHDNESCTRLQNYTIVYMNMAASRNSAPNAKNRHEQSTAHHDKINQWLDEERLSS